LESIAPGGEAAVTFHPNRESGVQLRWRGAQGEACDGSVDAYRERGVRGRIDVQIVECHKLKIEQDVGYSLFRARTLLVFKRAPSPSPLRRGDDRELAQTVLDELPAMLGEQITMAASVALGVTGRKVV
jgi:hypothetical protein